MTEQITNKNMKGILMVSNAQKIKALRNPKIRNLLLNNAAYKQASISAFGITKNRSTKLLQKIDKELEK
jgi:hypothetical protein